MAPPLSLEDANALLQLGAISPDTLSLIQASQPQAQIPLYTPPVDAFTQASQIVAPTPYIPSPLPDPNFGLMADTNNAELAGQYNYIPTAKITQAAPNQMSVGTMMDTLPLTPTPQITPTPSLEDGINTLDALNVAPIVNQTSTPSITNGSSQGLDAYSKAVQAQSAILGNQAALEQQNANQKIALNNQGMAAVDNQIAKLNEGSANFNQENDAINQQISKYEQIQEQQRKELGDMTLDPKRYWKNSNTFSKILAGIGIALGAAGQALTGKDNGALKIIMDAVDDDIRMQQVEIQNKRAVLGDTTNRILALYQKTGNLRQATELTRAMDFSVVNSLFQKYSLQIQNAEAKAKAQTAGNEFLLKRQELIKDLAVQQIKSAPQIGKGRYSTGAQGLAGLSKEDIARSFSLPDGTTLFGNDQKRVGDFIQDIYIPDAKAYETINELLRLNSLGTKVSLADRARAQTLAASLRGSIRPEIAGPGNSNETENKWLIQVAADPSQISSIPSQVKARFNILKSKIESTLNNYGEVLFATPNLSSLTIKRPAPVATKSFNVVGKQE